MKTLKSKIKMLAMVSILFTSFVFANNPDAVVKENSYNEIRKEIEKKISFPEFAKQITDKQSVLVSFTLDRQGNINIIGTKGENKELNIFVEEKLNGEKISTVTVDSTQTFNIELKFRIL